MLQAFWKLSGKPFDKSLKADQLFLSKTVKELNSRLEYMKQNRGIMLVSGLPGTGKTTVLRAFRDNLSDLSFKTFYVPLATVNVIDFYKQLNFQLSGELCHFKTQLFVSIQKNIMDLVTDQKKIPVIIFDEAHLMKNENFTELQLLLNFNMDSADPALVILAGQDHLIDRLMRPVLRSFYQRVTLKHHLMPLDKQEIKPFIEHHLSLKGNHAFPFADNAIEAIYKNSNGVPRLVANCCINTMTLGMIENVQLLNEEHVFQASQEL
jgi:type II secretory pathway predicted ATPase ExeA